MGSGGGSSGRQDGQGEEDKAERTGSACFTGKSHERIRQQPGFYGQAKSETISASASKGEWRLHKDSGV
jgi:hypothetical protein